MDLNFTQQPEGWVAEFELTADANLHIERDERGYMEVLQRSPEGGQYARVEGLDAYAFDLVNDLDLTAIIYPKYIKVVSAVLPTYAVVTSAGEVTEIKSQTKEIEVTANGTTEVTPDAGFAYLNSVTIKTNVPQSGEGGGADSGDWEYFDVGSTVGSSDNSSMSMYAAYFAGLVKLVEYRDEVITAKKIGPIMYAFANADYHYYSQLAINMATTCVGEDGVRTLRERIELLPNSQLAQIYSALSSFPRITEAEFYNLNNGGGIA